MQKIKITKKESEEQPVMMAGVAFVCEKPDGSYVDVIFSRHIVSTDEGQDSMYIIYTTAFLRNGNLTEEQVLYAMRLAYNGMSNCYGKILTTPVLAKADSGSYVAVQYAHMD